MKIGIDASSLSKDKVTGVENYVRSLILKFAKIDAETKFFLYTPDDFYDFPKLPGNFQIVKRPAKRFWSQTVLPKLINSDQPNCAYFPSNIISPFVKCPLVYHFHDLAYKYFPEAYSPSDRLRQSLALKQMRKAISIITASESTKNDLVKHLNIDPGKIMVIPFGYNEELKRYATVQEYRQGIIFIGRLERRKNLLNLLEGYQLYCQKTSHPEKLDLIGGHGWGYEEIIQSITKLQSQGLDITNHGYLSNDDCYSKLGKARVFLYPSLYEGFGLPVLEAFATKTPVITSNSSSLPEVAETAALLVNPQKPEEIAVALQKILSDSKLTANLVDKGLERLKNYSWEKTAKATIKVLRNAARK